LIEIAIDEPFAETVDEEGLRALLGRALESEGAGDAEVTLLFTGDDTVRELNARYRGQDETTDVLSFGLAETAGAGFRLPPGIPRQLGEIVISHEQAERQARAFNNPLPRELELLVVHGLLHLLGYDHEKPDDRLRMAERERTLLAASSLIDRAHPPETGDAALR
jgi:probable rRNA maturation factor